MTRLFVCAANVHQGGGAVLLLDLLRKIPPDIVTVAIVDERLQLPKDLPQHVQIQRIPPKLVARLLVEHSLVKNVLQEDHVLCFGNLPPLFEVRGHVTVFLQNRYLIDPNTPSIAFDLKTRIRIWVERMWLFWRRFNAQQYIVQTSSMKGLAEYRLGLPVICMPFMPSNLLEKVFVTANLAAEHYDFLYVASGESHKNHVVLIKAWSLLADDGYFPSLVITLSPETEKELCSLINKLVASRGLRIKNIGTIPHFQMNEVYLASKALIYPSSFESFGLPLIEARNAGLPVLAPELDYVRDVTDPDQTFDPYSPLSISRAVLRHLKGCKSQFKVHGSEEFLELILSKVKP